MPQSASRTRVSPVLEGGGGLKQAFGSYRVEVTHVSPVLEGGGGLKQVPKLLEPFFLVGFPRARRRGRIETAVRGVRGGRETVFPPCSKAGAD